jgi:molybdopterin-guanine dinucleotide biosynthesis protein A
MLVASVRADGAVFVDGDGREQWLCGAWRTHALRALPLDAGLSLGRALAALDVARVAAPARERMAWFDCDTPDDRRRAEDLLT